MEHSTLGPRMHLYPVDRSRLLVAAEVSAQPEHFHIWKEIG
jgi:hypothetical protein